MKDQKVTILYNGEPLPPGKSVADLWREEEEALKKTMDMLDKRVEEHGYEITCDFFKAMCPKFGIQYWDVLPYLRSDDLQRGIIQKLHFMGTSIEKLANADIDSLSQKEKVFIIKAFNKARCPIVDLDPEFWRSVAGHGDPEKYNKFAIQTQARSEVEYFSSGNSTISETPYQQDCLFTRETTVTTLLGKTKSVWDLRPGDFVKFNGPLRNLSESPNWPSENQTVGQGEFRDEVECDRFLVRSVDFDLHGGYIITTSDGMGITNNEEMRRVARSCYKTTDILPIDTVRLAAAGQTDMERRALVDFLYDIKCKMSYVDMDQAASMDMQLRRIVNDTISLDLISNTIRNALESIGTKVPGDLDLMEVEKAAAIKVNDLYYQKIREQKYELAMKCATMDKPVFLASDVNITVGKRDVSMESDIPNRARVTGIAYDVNNPDHVEEFDIKYGDIISVHQSGSAFVIEFEQFAISSIDISQTIEQVREAMERLSEEQSFNDKEDVNFIDIS